MHIQIINPRMPDIGNVLRLFTLLGPKGNDVGSVVGAEYAEFHDEHDFELQNVSFAYGARPAMSRRDSGGSAVSVARSMRDKKLQKASEAIWKEFW